MINFNSKQYFILGTSTDIGKTYFVEKICQKLRRDNININAIKPLISGFDINDKNNDSFKIIKSLDLESNEDNLNKISPFRLKEAFSPLKAAKMEGIQVNFDEIVSFCKDNIEKSSKIGQNLLIEGAGGVMTPINEEKTFLDLAEELSLKVILVGGVFLGAISQILCCIEVLRSRNIDVEAVIINDFGVDDSGLDYEDIKIEVENFSKVKCFTIRDII